MEEVVPKYISADGVKWIEKIESPNPDVEVWLTEYPNRGRIVSVVKNKKLIHEFDYYVGHTNLVEEFKKILLM